MLKAILHGKAGRIRSEGDAPLSWRQVFRQREDLLTATIFGRFAYLSAACQQKILGFLLTPELACLAGKVNEIQFWPRLKTHGINELEHRTLVEPDVWICCDGLDIVIEVKPPFGGVQQETQWLAEVLAVNKASKQKEESRSTRLALVALGNNQCVAPSIAEKSIYQAINGPFSLHLMNWPEFCYFFFSLRTEHFGTDLAVICDIIDAFSIFGLKRPVPGWAPLLKLSHSFDGDLLPLKSIRQPTMASSAMHHPVKQRTHSTEWLPLLAYCQSNALDLPHE